MVTLNEQPSTAGTSGEERARARLTELDGLFKQRSEAIDQHDESTAHAVEVNIVIKMRQVGDAYPDEESKSEWYKKAEAFEKGSTEEKNNILMPLAQGLGILIATPFALAGGAIFAAGGILYGAGKTIQGVGNVLTGGMFQ